MNLKGYPKGKYLKSNKVNKNKQYALEAISYLQNYPDVTYNLRNEIWKTIFKKLSINKKKHNSQMDVVIALYLNNLLLL